MHHAGHVLSSTHTSVKSMKFRPAWKREDEGRRGIRVWIQLSCFLFCTRVEKGSAVTQRRFCLTTETLLWENCTKPVLKSPRVGTEGEAEELLKTFISKPKLMNIHFTHTHTRRLKPKTAALKTGPCRSLLGLNLVCLQSCSSPFPSAPSLHFKYPLDLSVFTKI